MTLFHMVSAVFGVVGVSDLMSALLTDRTKRERTARLISGAASVVAALLLLPQPFEAWMLHIIFVLGAIIVACQAMFACDAFARLRRARAKERA